MSKKRKTRKEKNRSVIRLSTQARDSAPVYSIDTSSVTTAAPISTISSINSALSAKEYGYVLHDAKKTFLITSILFASSIVLYFIVQNHIINLSFFGY